MSQRSLQSLQRAAIAAIAFGAALVPATARAQISAAAPPETAAEALTLTLEDAVRRAVDHNPDLVVVRLDTEIGAARVGQSQGAFAPVFSTVLGHSSNTTPPSNFLLGDRGVDLNDWFSSTGVRQRLKWGAGTWSLSWDSSRTTTNNPISSFDPSLQSGFQLAFSQPLLRDRKIDSARQQYIIARRNQESSELRFREAVVQTIAEVKQAYWTLKANLANIGVQQRSLELAQQLARENKVRVGGQVPPRSVRWKLRWRSGAKPDSRNHRSEWIVSAG